MVVLICVIFRLSPQPCVTGKWLFSMVGGESWSLKSSQRPHSPWALWPSVTSLHSPLDRGLPQYILSLSMLGSLQRARWPPAFIALHHVPKLPVTDAVKHFIDICFGWSNIVLFHILDFTILLWMMKYFIKTQMWNEVSMIYSSKQQTITHVSGSVSDTHLNQWSDTHPGLCCSAKPAM